MPAAKNSSLECELAPPITGSAGTHIAISGKYPRLKLLGLPESPEQFTLWT